MLEQVYLGLLGIEVSSADVKRGLGRVQREGAAGIVVPPSLLGATEGTATAVATVAGFPTGKHHTLVKAAEARLAVQFGAAEVGVVVDPVVARNDTNALLAEVVAVREAVPHPASLAVVIEAALLDDAQLAAFAHTVRLAGADRVIVGTGYHQLGGADTEDVAVLAAELAKGRRLRLGAIADSSADAAELLATGADQVIVPDLAGAAGQ